MWPQSLFGGGEPTIDERFEGLRRHELGQGAWVEHLPGWLRGHDTLFETLRTTTRWEAGQRWMYERVVDVPRLTASLPGDGPGHPVIETIAAALAARYPVRVHNVSLAFYRDGRDGVAWHGDRGEAALEGAMTISVSLGAPRRLLMRPAGGGRSLAFGLGFGDLFVMGGTCQRTWQHGIPKCARADPRMAVLFWCRPPAG